MSVGWEPAGRTITTTRWSKAGFAEEAAKIQDLYLAGRKDEAIKAVPDAYVERGVLIGTPAQIAERYVAWAESGVTGITIATKQPEALELMAELATRTPAIGPAAAMTALEATAGRSVGGHG